MKKDTLDLLLLGVAHSLNHSLFLECEVLRVEAGLIDARDSRGCVSVLT